MENEVATAEPGATLPAEESVSVHDQSLDEILAGVEDRPAQPEQVETPQQSDDLAFQLKAIKDQQAQFQQQQSQKELDQALGDLVSFVRTSDEGIETAYDDEELRALLEYRAIQNPKIAVAFGNQFSDPATWNNVKKSLAADLAKKAAGKFSNVEQRMAAETSVRGVSNTPPPQEDLPSQSEIADMAVNDPAAFRRFKEKLG